MLTDKLKKMNDNFKQVSEALKFAYPSEQDLSKKSISEWTDNIKDFNKKRQPTTRQLSKKPVKFLDYDGKELYAYEKDEFLVLTELPELPSQPGLVCQGWNWALEDAKTYVQEYGRLDIGATYITDNNKTRLYINLLKGEMTIPLYINQSVANGVTVGWGDGNSETVSGTGNVIFNHTYNEAGSYMITLTVNSGTCTLGRNNSSYCVMGSTSTIASGSLYKVEIGSNMSIGNYAFQHCYSLQSVTIPNSVTSIGGDAFKYCTSLQSVTIPNSVTSIGERAFQNCNSLTSITIPNSVTSINNYAFYYCTSLQSVTIPNSVTSIGYYTFKYCHSLQSVTIPNSVTSIGGDTFHSCYSLTSITIPNSVTSIGEEAFSGCTSLQSVTIPNSVTSIGSYTFQNCSMQYYYFTSHTSIPTLSNTNAFSGIKDGCEIRVPAVLYEDWINATNWSSYKGYIVMDADITEYTSLTITADDVSGNKTNTKIYWEAIANGVNKYTGEVVTGIKLIGMDGSDVFEQNTSTTDTVTRTITYTKYGLTATTTITQGVWVDQSYTIDLNSNWQLSSTISNPNSSLYDGVYESYSNKGINSTAAIMYIDIKGYTDFSLYIRSYAESNSDYVMVSQLDQTINNSTSYSNTTLVKAHTRGSQTSGTAISNYKLVEFTGIDSGEHRITIVYRKDSSGASGDDRGYLIIPK